MPVGKLHESHGFLYNMCLCEYRHLNYLVVIWLQNHENVSSCGGMIANVGAYWRIDQSNKFHDAPVPYPTLYLSEQKCSHVFSEWSTVVYGKGALTNSLIRSIGQPVPRTSGMWIKLSCSRNQRSALQIRVYKMSDILFRPEYAKHTTVKSIT